MAFWSGETLLKRIKEEELIEGFDEELIDCSAYTLRLGGEAFITKDGKDREAALQRGTTPGLLILDERDTVSIPSGQFALLLTEEVVRIPNNALGFISVKAGRKFDGLINVSGFHVDPGWNGKLIFAVFNAGPQTIVLERREKLFLLFYSDLTDSLSRLPAKSGRVKRKPGHQFLPAEMIQKMSGPVPSLFKLNETTKDLEAKVGTVEGRVLLAAGTASLALIISLALFGRALWTPKDPARLITPSCPTLPTPQVSGSLALPTTSEPSTGKAASPAKP